MATLAGVREVSDWLFKRQTEYERELIMKLTLTYKPSFGNDRYYPACKDSEIICKLAVIKSFTQNQVHMMRREGWEIDIKAAIPA